MNSTIKNDPFGNLMDWGPVLDILGELSEGGKLTKYQPGLIRILRYKGNWRLREETLKRVGEIQSPSDDLILQVIDILGDDNIYYDARILAGNALIQLLKNLPDNFSNEMSAEIQKVIKKLRNTPQPPFFKTALERFYSELRHTRALEN
ncbi:MAG: hypothetical protein WA081_17745 [Desulfosalsimonadaceae bacterium]|jgi:hypothetical protein|nr:MAG: hypothetical protein C4518_09250 [Desulfobacteraceae bacterium]